MDSDSSKDHSKNSSDKEVALNELFSLFLEDESVHDVKLKGCDGVEVSANRCVLALRSRVFRGMLLGGFAESGQEVVAINEYKGEVLRYIVEYVHTDSAQLFDSKKREHDNSAEQISTLLSLVAAATYFNLPKLVQKAEDNIFELVDAEPAVAFLLLDACRKEGPAIPAELSQRALDLLRQGHVSVSATAVSDLSRDVLEEILKDDQLYMTEFEVFEVFRLWVEPDPINRKPIATKLMKHIRLENIAPSKLSTVVEPLGIVSSGQLLQAYMKQSLAQEQGKPTVYHERRGGPFWKRSKSRVADLCEKRFDVLDCFGICAGIHKWTVELIGEDDDYVNVGIAASGVDLDEEELLGDQRAGWAVNGDGEAFTNGTLTEAESPDTTPIKSGDKVTFTLNLIPSTAGNGTLTWSKEGLEASFQIFSDLCDVLEDYPSGFVPAVSCEAYKTRFRLVDFEKVHN